MLKFNRFFSFQVSSASFFLPRAILGVLFPYLVTIYLLETPGRIGFAISVAMLPSLFMLLIAGFIADHFDKRLLLLILHLLNAVPVFALVVLIDLELVSYGALLIFAVASGMALAFVQPTIDGMLNHITDSALRRGVNISVGLMYLINLLGFTLAGLVGWIGLTPILMLSGCLFLLGVISTLKLPAVPPQVDTKRKNPIWEVAEGGRVTFTSKTLRLPVLLLSSAGLLLGGPYEVLVPILLRENYQATAIDFSAAFAIFMVGGALSSFALLKLGRVRFQLELLLAGYAVGGLVLISWSTNLPYWAFLASIFIWGIGGGICLNISRSILQEHAPATHKSRVLSVMYFGDDGGSPIGAFLIALIISGAGASQSALIPGVIVVVVAVFGLVRVKGTRRDIGQSRQVENEVP